MIYAQPTQNITAVVENVPLGPTPGVRIIDDDGDIVRARTTAGVIALGGGVFRATLAAPASTGTFFVQWDVGESVATETLVVAPNPIEGPTVPLYPTTADLVAQSPVQTLTSLPEAQQDALRAAAISAVEEHVGQSFTPFTGTLPVPSEGGYEVMLPRRLRALTAVYSSRGDLLEPDAIAIGPKNDRILWRRDVVGVGYYEQALYEISGRDYASKFGTDTLMVDGDWGWDYVPQPVVDAIRYDMEDQAMADANALTPTVQVFRKLGIQSIDQGNLRATLGPVAGLSPRVTRLLEPYVFLGTGGYVV